MAHEKIKTSLQQYMKTIINKGVLYQSFLSNFQYKINNVVTKVKTY